MVSSGSSAGFETGTEEEEEDAADGALSNWVNNSSVIVVDGCVCVYVCVYGIWYVACVVLAVLRSC